MANVSKEEREFWQKVKDSWFKEEGPNSTDSSTTDSSAPRYFRKKAHRKTTTTPKGHPLIRLLRFSLLMASGVALWLNVQPYIELTNRMLSDSGDFALAQALGSNILTHWLTNLAGSLLSFVIGVCVWGIFQILELLPMFMMGSRRSLRQLIDGLETIPGIPINDSDDDFLAELKEKHNRLPQSWIQTALFLGTLAYLVDFICCLLYFPPIKGGFETLGLFMAAPTWGDVDLQNLVFALITLFAVEWVVWLWLWLKNVNEHF